MLFDRSDGKLPMILAPAARTGPIELLALSQEWLYRKVFFQHSVTSVRWLLPEPWKLSKASHHDNLHVFHCYKGIGTGDSSGRLRNHNDSPLWGEVSFGIMCGSVMHPSVIPSATSSLQSESASGGIEKQGRGAQICSESH